MMKSRSATLSSRLLAAAETSPGRPALADSSGSSLTYAEVLTSARRLAAWLLDTRPNERHIGVCLPSSVPAALANYAITLSGKVAVNLNFSAGLQNCRTAIKLCSLDTIFTSRAFLNKTGIQPIPAMVLLEDLPAGAPIESSLPDIQPDDTACILFSSGSTGLPKGVELTHWNVVANAEGLASRLPPSEEDCMLGVLPFFHSFGYTFALWFPVLHGLRAVYHGNPTDAKTLGDLAQRHRTTYLLSTPTFCQQYAHQIPASQFSSMRYVIVGAEKLRDSVACQFKNHFGFDLLAGYGCTELGPGVAVNTPSESKHGSVGRPLAGIEIRIADPDTMNPLAAGEQGMILVNGPSRMPGYYGLPELTAQVIRDGFYVTGDLGYVDEDGFLYVTDRLARFSKVAGEMVPHLRLEEVISDLTPSFVTGVADDRRGERLVLLYTDADTGPEEIYQKLVAAELPPLWIPKREDMHHVATIPALPSGKVDLAHARDLARTITSPRHSPELI